jgi:hypothetical protein
MMSIKYGFLCLLALGVVFLLIFKNYEIWTQPVEWASEKNVGKRPQSKAEDKPEAFPSFGTQKNPAFEKSYISISEKNLFSPERKDFPTPAGSGSGKKQLLRPQILLYGVTIAGNYEAASVANPGRPLHKGERETFTVKKGERIGEYKVVKISFDRVTLEADGDSFEVLLYDPSMSKRRSSIRTESKPATITSTQPIPSSPVPGLPPPTPPTPSAVVPKPTPPVGPGQERAVAPAPATPGGQALPRPDFPRRRPYYPPSVPSQKTEGN